MIICALIAFYPFIRGRMQLRFCRPRFSIKMIRQIVSCGAPSFLNNIAGRITSILMNTVLLQMGGERAVSVYGILMFADGVVQPLLYGLCDSLQPAVGYNWGAGNLSRVKAIEKRCFLASAVLALAAAVTIFSFPEMVTRLFMGDTDEATMTMAVTALGIFSMTYLTRWFSFATQSFMSAIERPLQASSYRWEPRWCFSHPDRSVVGTGAAGTLVKFPIDCPSGRDSIRCDPAFVF